MSISSIRRWHWMVLSIGIGLLFYYTRLQVTNDLARRFGESINSQRMFEDMLVTTEQGRHKFDNVTVHTQLMPDGKGSEKPVQIVSGTAFNGHYEQEAGKVVARWRPMFFVASTPYKPRLNLSQLRQPGGPDYAGEFRAIQNPSVADFLKILSQAKGVTYQHAWWRELTWWQYVAASFVVIGMIWPTLLNLLFFGSLWRPAVAKATSLANVQAHTRSSESHAGIPLTVPDGEATLQTEAPAPEPAAAPAVAQLSTTAVEAAPAEPGATTEFGADRDDYYPTEVHVPNEPK